MIHFVGRYDALDNGAFVCRYGKYVSASTDVNKHTAAEENAARNIAVHQRCLHPPDLRALSYPMTRQLSRGVS